MYGYEFAIYLFISQQTCWAAWQHVVTSVSRLDGFVTIYSKAKKYAQLKVKAD